MVVVVVVVCCSLCGCGCGNCYSGCFFVRGGSELVTVKHVVVCVNSSTSWSNTLFASQNYFFVMATTLGKIPRTGACPVCGVRYTNLQKHVWHKNDTQHQEWRDVRRRQQQEQAACSRGVSPYPAWLAPDSASTMYRRAKRPPSNGGLCQKALPISEKRSRPIPQQLQNAECHPHIDLVVVADHDGEDGCWSTTDDIVDDSSNGNGAVVAHAAAPPAADDGDVPQVVDMTAPPARASSALRNVHHALRPAVGAVSVTSKRRVHKQRSIRHMFGGGGGSAVQLYVTDGRTDGWKIRRYRDRHYYFVAPDGHKFRKEVDAMIYGLSCGHKFDGRQPGSPTALANLATARVRHAKEEQDAAAAAATAAPAVTATPDLTAVPVSTDHHAAAILKRIRDFVTGMSNSSQNTFVKRMLAAAVTSPSSGPSLRTIAGLTGLNRKMLSEELRHSQEAALSQGDLRARCSLAQPGRVRRSDRLADQIVRLAQVRHMGACHQFTILPHCLFCYSMRHHLTPWLTSRRNSFTRTRLPKLTTCANER